MKTVVINALSALRGGGQTYLLHLFKYTEEYKDIKVILIVSPQASFLFEQFPIQIVAPSLAGKGIFFRTLWEKLFLPRLLKQWNAAVFFCPGGILSTHTTERIKTVVAFRNMIPFSPLIRKKYPVGFMRLRHRLLFYIFSQSFREAAVVIFLSRYAKEVIDSTVKQRRGTSVVIYHGLSDEFRMKQGRTHDIPGEYILYVSPVHVYKSQLEVIEAWYSVCRQRKTDETLVLIGPTYQHYEKIVRRKAVEYQNECKVKMLGTIPYEQLPSYYQHAKINLFASTCENCPNILLEALGAGRPLFCSDFQPMPEIAEDAVVYFNPLEPQKLASLLLRYLDDTSMLSTMAEKAYKQSLKYQWKDSVKKTWEVLSQ